jgi:hypothetical protein
LNAIDGKPVAGKDVVVKYDEKKPHLTQADTTKKKKILKI